MQNSVLVNKGEGMCAGNMLPGFYFPSLSLFQFNNKDIKILLTELSLCLKIIHTFV